MAFDGFEDGDYTTNPTWVDYSDPGAGTITVTTDAKKNGVYGVRFTTAGNADTGMLRLRVSGQNDATGNYYAWIRISNINGYSFYYGYDSLNHLVFAFTISARAFYWRSITGWEVFSIVPAANTWYRLRATRIDANTVNYYIYDLSDTVIDSALNKEIPDGAGNVGNLTDILMDILDTTSAYNTDFDDVSYSDTNEPPMAYFLFR